MAKSEDVVGHPPLISTEYVAGILKGPFIGGLKRLLRKHQHDALE